MQAESKEKLRAIAGQLDAALLTFESILESEDLAALYRATHSLQDALKSLHDHDPSLLPPEALTRVQELLNKERKKAGGRDNFNTGF
jgi:predicted metal-dependent phosphoesterase TrpH